jgi:hypothetical protein
MEKDLWRMIDEADAHNYGNFASQLKRDMEKRVQVRIDRSPETVRRDIGKASDNLYKKMDQLRRLNRTIYHRWKLGWSLNQNMRLSANGI